MCLWLCFAGVMSAFTVSFPVAGSSSGTIRFTHYITNIGGHYSTTTGVFTCVYPGIYYFALHILRDSGSTIAYCHIRKNGSNVVEVYSKPETASSDSYDGTTNSVVLHLVGGDKVDLGGCSAISTIQVNYDYDTTFSGFLLKAD